MILKTSLHTPPQKLLFETDKTLTGDFNYSKCRIVEPRVGKEERKGRNNNNNNIIS